MFNENVGRDIRALAFEKSIDVERVFSALEDALSTAAKKYYKTREPIETVMDRENGAVEVYVVKDVVATPEAVLEGEIELWRELAGRPVQLERSSSSFGSLTAEPLQQPFHVLRCEVR